MSKKSVRDLEVAGKRLFLRVDFNVPLEDRGISDDTRIRAALPTLRLLRERGAKIILASHLGRPKGERRPELSLAPVADHLGDLLETEVVFVSECVGEKASSAVGSLSGGDVLLLENLRFSPGETANDPEFAKRLAAQAELFATDAFGTAHRAHASTVGVPSILGQGAAGLLVERELEVLGRLLESPELPLIAVFGGAKVSDKLDVIENFLGRASDILLGGGMAFTFLRARGEEIGRSLLEEEKLQAAGSVLEQASRKDTRIHLPIDVRVVSEISPEANSRIVPVSEIPTQQMGVDIGPETAAHFVQVLQKAKTIIWNGPMGVFEIEAFSDGTMKVARAIADAAAFSLVGGGDSVLAVRRAGVAEDVDHLSTGGGASLEFLAGRTLPGIEVLDPA